MFGYATDETEEAMPLSLLLAHQLQARLHKLRREGILDWSLPDSKSQVLYLCSLDIDKQSRYRINQDLFYELNLEF
jgi:S-adenosylmethionine synthetase